MEAIMKKFKTAEEIKKHFIKNGWSDSIDFEPFTLERAEKMGVFDIIQNIKKGHQYFRMTATGNIYDDRSEVRLYNINPSDDATNIAAGL